MIIIFRILDKTNELMKYLSIILLLLSFNLPLFSTTELDSDPAFIEVKSKLDPAWKIYIKKNHLSWIALGDANAV